MHEPTEYEKELARTLGLIQKTPTYYFYNKLAEEAGEVAEVASAYMGSNKKVKKILSKYECLEEAMLEELGDTVNVVMILAARHNLTFDEVVEAGRQKFKTKNDKRDNDQIRQSS
jgi:NTP pyrophosphatase (non-canonical NTP hydrolase)